MRHPLSKTPRPYFFIRGGQRLEKAQPTRCTSAGGAYAHMRQTRQCTQRPFFGAIAAKYTPRLGFSGFASQFLKRAICIFARRKEYAPHPQPKKVQQKAAPSGGGKLPLLPLCRNVIKNNFILRKEETDCIAIPPLWCIMLITIISFSGGIKWITSAKESLQIISGESKPPRFCLFPPICRTAFAGKVNAARIL